MISGKYTKTFVNATHALPQGMHMNADYPFMLPKIIKKTGKEITIEGYSGKTYTAKIIRYNGSEHINIMQSSSFERMCNKEPHKFKCLPFIDNQ